MNGFTDLKSLLGISIRTDGYTIGHKSSSEPWQAQDIVVGSILCRDSTMPVNDFRHLLVEKFPSLPESFKFLSKKGWPIDTALENEITILQLIDEGHITIQKYFDVPRVGIKWNDGDFVGFIFINYNSALVEVRKVISSEMADVLHSDMKFVFKDTKGWPILESQEKKLTLWDICLKDYIIISKGSYKRKLEKDLSEPHRSTKLAKMRSKYFTFKGKPRQTSHLNPIVISYVHKEATTHARNLKRELVNLGHTVFLDTDDIPVGQDWQDTINMALTNCSAFVALVTPNYGQTTWTNREAKLADEKEKLIIPISFLDKWPPDPLAIQFLTLQYIPWRTIEELNIAKEKGENTEANDITFWDPGCVHRVAKEIKKICSNTDLLTPDSSTQETITELDTSNVTSSHTLNLQHLKYEHTDSAIDIVINAHPEQKDFVEEISAALKMENYKVWSSTDIEGPWPCEKGTCTPEDSQPSPSQCDFPSSFNSLNSNDDFTVTRQPYMYSCSMEDGVQYLQDNSQDNTDTDADVQDNIKKMKKFKRKIKESKMVILIISKEYCRSRTCVQQAFYCESRKKVIAIKWGTFLTQCKIFNLYPEEDMLEIDENLIRTLIHRIDTELNSMNDSYKNHKIGCELNSERDSYKNRIEALAMNLKSEIPMDCCVYVISGVRFLKRVTESFCHVLGSELAQVSNLTLLTEGFFGASELVGRNFCEEREILAKGKPRKTFHILPRRDNKNFTTKARQQDDGAFQKIPYGRTLFYGNSVAERDDIVSSLFKICILIEGDTRSIRIAEKFSWNDCTVIPVIFSDERKSIIKNIIRQVPCGVLEADWQVLDNPDCSAEHLAKTVKKIVCTLLKKRCKEKT